MVAKKEQMTNLFKPLFKISEHIHNINQLLDFYLFPKFLYLTISQDQNSTMTVKCYFMQESRLVKKAISNLWSCLLFILWPIQGDMFPAVHKQIR